MDGISRSGLACRAMSAVFAVFAIFMSVSCSRETVDENGGGNGLHISINVFEVTESAVQYEVTAVPEDKTYLCGVVSESEFSSFQDPGEFLQDRLAAVREEAESEGNDADAYLAGILRSGTASCSVSGLAASTEYVVYAAGVNPDYTVTSEVEYEMFSTPEPEEEPLFSFSPELQGLDARVTVTPSEEIGDMYYFYVTVDKSVLDWRYGGLENLQEGYAKFFKETIDELVLYMKYTIPEAVASISWKGTQTFPVLNMIPDTEYYMIAAAIDENTGKPATDVCYGTFMSNKGGDLSTFTIEFKIGEVNGDQVEVEAIPSDNMVRYYFDRTDPDVPDENIIPDLYSLIQEYIDYGVIADANGYYANWCSIGPDKFTYTGLEKGTYRIYGFGIDNSGQVATDLMFSEEFTVGQ